ncbi:MFS transporter [Siphonobacter sp.]|uniref:MFS transporter n=1 Tax=Siphonobacter sp. TaxID=1869184 RepID=UPI003B3B2C75
MPETLAPASVTSPRTLRSVIAASSVGTLIEWYDFYIFGSLSAIISTQFFPKDNPTAALLSALAVFAAGFIVRPFGALVFGRLGDIVGRKYTFMVTLLLMGGSTFLIGLIPGYESWGMLSPLLVLLLRLIQGLALGGEYGGAATYVAEYAPPERRGYFTSWIQTTATLGLFVSLAVIVATRKILGVEDFESWGWRIPFLVSIVLVGTSVFIRLKMNESPVFSKLKSEGKVSKNPLAESFGKRENLKMVLLALLGATAGQGVVWYTGQFYALSFIQKVGHVDFEQSSEIVAIALALATGGFVLFGWLSDRWGRKVIILGGMALAVLTYRPLYQQMYALTDLSTKTEVSTQTSIQNQSTTQVTSYTDGSQVQKISVNNPQGTEVKYVLSLGNTGYWTMVFLIWIQVLYVTMVYGPIAAFLVEMFPTRIRYTSMSLPYHIGNGIFGGLTPFLAVALVEKATANQESQPYLAGLWYPILVAAICFIIGFIYLSSRNRIHE